MAGLRGPHLERLSEWAGKDARVEFDQKIVGKFSESERQVDILISGRFANITDREMTCAVDCKYYTKNVDVKAVDSFIGSLEDVQTDMGILITNKGYSPAAKRRAKQGMELQVIVAEVDRLPPSYFSSWNEGYYESDYYEGGPVARNKDGAVIRYHYIDPDSLQYSFDPDHPPEELDDVVLVGTSDELSWGDDENRAKCVRAILEHRNSGVEPSDEDVKRLVLDLV